MHKLITIFLLLIHINTSMFMPVMEEVDIFDAYGAQVDDINTTYEYIDQVVLGHKDDTPEDEDDDQPHYFNMVHVKAFVAPSFELNVPPSPEAPHWVEKTVYGFRPQGSWMSVTHEIAGPPPKA